MITISIGLRGLFVIFLLVFGFLDLRIYVMRGFFLSVALFSYVRMLRQLRSRLPAGWRVREAVWGFYRIYKEPAKKVLAVAVHVESSAVKDRHGRPATSYDFVEFTWRGVVDSPDMFPSARRINAESKEAVRGARLEELGI